MLVLDSVKIYIIMRAILSRLCLFVDLHSENVRAILVVTFEGCDSHIKNVSVGRGMRIIEKIIWLKVENDKDPSIRNTGMISV